eukprot:TRINITY_DN16768_c0_g5_i1.p1 TRINITY_DN16768_c0_g5~~TRINITY_DN16768_c0_g5_i1.p1  ORF type:complete len:501 (+),score=75.72 TRINITY_DN16768_c0_g5_i1:137-1639(+)
MKVPLVVTFFLLLCYVKAIHSQNLPHRHLHHHQEDHREEFGQENDGRNERMLGVLAPGPKLAPRPAAVPSEGLTPAPAAAPLPGVNASVAPPLGSGFNPRAANDSHCGAPLRKPSLSLARSIFFDLLQGGLPDNMTLKGNLTHLSSWRSILKDLLKLGTQWPEIRKMGTEYFNLTLPKNPAEIASKLPKYDSLTSRRRLLQSGNPMSFVVPTYIVVVTDPNSFYSNGESVTLNSINQQMKVLNIGFQGTGFTFKLAANPILVKDPVFFTANDGSEIDFRFKSKFRKGGPEALNVYIRKPTAADLEEDMTLLGIARFPEALCVKGVPDAAAEKDDGISLFYETMPDQSYNYLGATLVHETGHWLGLMHTFNQPSSCDAGIGDGVTATNIEYGPYNQNPNYVSGVCDLSTDSCPNQPGTDPITNWMDYSPDDCYTKFTSEQITYMQANYLHLRQQKQCSYPGQKSPYLETVNAQGGSRRASGHPLLTVLFALGLIMAAMSMT